MAAPFYVSSICSTLMLAMALISSLRLEMAAASEKAKFLALHNEARAEVGVAPLKWNAELEAYATAYSPTCALVHSGGRYGENLFIGNGKEWGAEDAVGMWVEEKSSYDYGRNACDFGAQCGHYTQVVWRDTTALGCATSHCGDGSTFIICSYNPPGNYIDQRPF